MSYTRPDVYVEETLSQPYRRSALLSTPLPTFIGESRRGPAEFTIVDSWADYVRLFGGFTAGGGDSHLPYAVHAYFRTGGSACAIQRVLASAVANATITLVDREATTPVDTLTVNAKSAGSWGDDVRIGIVDRDATDGRFDLIVYEGGETSGYVVERFSDVTMDSTDPRYVVSVVNANVRGSNYVTLTDEGSASAAPDNTPAAGTFTLDGGDDGTLTEADFIAATDLVDISANSLLINIPGEQRVDVLSAVVAMAEGRKDSFVIIDTPPGLNGGDAVVFADSLTTSSYAAAYWPWLNVSDAALNRGGSTRLVPPGGPVMGVYVNSDRTLGPHKTPAGRGASLPGVQSLEIEPTLSELGVVNAGHVNAIRTFPGEGAVVYGGRTLRKTGSDRYISIRRSMIYLNASLSELVAFAIFESNDERTWKSIRDEVDRFLNAFWTRGGLRGDTAEEAYFIKCDETNNTPQKIQEGILTVEVGVALQRPAEFIVLKIGQFETGEITIEEVA